MASRDGQIDNAFVAELVGRIVGGIVDCEDMLDPLMPGQLDNFESLFPAGQEAEHVLHHTAGRLGKSYELDHAGAIASRERAEALRPVELVDLRTLRQPRRTGCCGYYALFNAVNLHGVLGALAGAFPGDEPVHMGKVSLRSQLRTTFLSKSKFHQFCLQVQTDLADYVLSRPELDAWQWSLNSICVHQLMERSHLGVLLHSSERHHKHGASAAAAAAATAATAATAAAGAAAADAGATASRPALLGNLHENLTVCLEFGLQGLRSGGHAKAEELDAVVKRFRERDSYHHVFIVGLANHWICCGAVKYTPKAPVPASTRFVPVQDGNPEPVAAGAVPTAVQPPAEPGRPRMMVFVCDSTLPEVHGRTDAQIRHHMGAWDFSAEDGGLPVAWQIRACLDSLQGQQFFVGMLGRGLAGISMPSQELTNLSAHHFMASLPAAALRGPAPQPADPALACRRFFVASRRRGRLVTLSRFRELYGDAPPTDEATGPNLPEEKAPTAPAGQAAADAGDGDSVDDQAMAEADNPPPPAPASPTAATAAAGAGGAMAGAAGPLERASSARSAASGLRRTHSDSSLVTEAAGVGSQADALGNWLLQSMPIPSVERFLHRAGTDDATWTVFWPGTQHTLLVWAGLLRGVLGRTVARMPLSESQQATRAQFLMRIDRAKAERQEGWESAAQRMSESTRGYVLRAFVAVSQFLKRRGSGALAMMEEPEAGEEEFGRRRLLGSVSALLEEQRGGELQETAAQCRQSDLCVLQ